MKLLVLLAVLGAVSAQYRLYTGVSPNYNWYYNPVPYTAQPFFYGALPYSFTSAERAVDDRVSEERLAVQSRSKRSAEDDQKADDATFVTTYATQPFGYTAGYPFTYPSPTVYSTYNNLPYNYHGCYGVHGCTIYNGYNPVVHSLKKRDTSAAEDQKAEDATFVSTYATHPLTYTAGYPVTYPSYPVANLYSYGHTTYGGFPYNYPYTFRTVY